MASARKFVYLYAGKALFDFCVACVFLALGLRVHKDQRGIQTWISSLDYTNPNASLSGRTVNMTKGHTFNIVGAITANLWIEFATQTAVLIGLACFQYGVYFNEGRHPLRWLSYAITASAQSACVGLYSGIVTMDGVMLLYFLTATVMMFGYLMELHPKTYDIFFLGSVAYLFRVVALWSNFFYNASDAPGFVYGIFIMNELLYAGFGVIGAIYCVYYERTITFYFKIDLAYCVFSVLAKTIIAGIAIGQPLSTL